MCSIFNFKTPHCTGNNNISGFALHFAKNAPTANQCVAVIATQKQEAEPSSKYTVPLTCNVALTRIFLVRKHKDSIEQTHLLDEEITRHALDPRITAGNYYSASARRGLKRHSLEHPIVDLERSRAVMLDRSGSYSIELAGHRRGHAPPRKHVPSFLMPL